MSPPPGRSLNMLHIKGSRKRDGKERGDGEVSLSDVLLEGSDGQMGGADEDVVVFFIHGSMGHMQQFEHQISCCAVSLQRDAAGRGCAHLSSALRKKPCGHITLPAPPPLPCPIKAWLFAAAAAAQPHPI